MWHFASGERFTFLYSYSPIMPFEWKRVPKMGSNPYLPVERGVFLGPQFISLANNEWNMLEKNIVASLKLDIQLNHWHHIGNDILPWTIAWIKISFVSLFFSLSVSLTLSPYLTFSGRVLPQYFLLWSWNNYLNQESRPSIYPVINLLVMTPHSK